MPPKVPLAPPPPWSRMVSAGVLCALLGLALVFGQAALRSQQQTSARRVGALAVADAAVAAAAEVDSGKSAKLFESIEREHQDIDYAFAVREGGVDEFGISRGSEVVHAKPPAVDAARLLDHSKRVSTDGHRALEIKQPLAVQHLFGEMSDGRLLVAVPVKDSSGNGVSAVAGAVLRKTTEDSPPLWIVAVLAGLAVLLAGVGRKLPLAPRVVDTASICAVVLVGWLLAPALPSAGPAGVAVLGGSRMVAHAAVEAGGGNAGPWLLGLLLLAAGAIGWLLDDSARVFAALRKDPVPYFYVGPAILATGLLIFVPFAVGVGLSFVDGEGHFVGIDHYIEVLTSVVDPNSSTHFFRTLALTTLWTAINVGFHVGFGLGLALVLNRPHLRARAFYRLLLIVPWAVPSYITALTWKWLFNTQFGPINAMLAALGHDRIDWLGNSPLSNFGANLATNVWLGFPFMMVISLGALQSIPSELYEAADIDGATTWQKFKHVTLPLLKPALFPAIILGTIWTFNAFNVIYLVSGGGPDHKTDILITEAYYTFTVLRRTGLAAAYSVLIFAILLLYTLITNRKTRATESVST